MIIVEAGPPDYFPTTPSSLDYAPEKTGQLPHTPANELQGEDGKHGVGRLNNSQA